MLSANRFWNPKKERFNHPGKRYARQKWTMVNLAKLDIALDSGGYVAMKKYGGFRFCHQEYLEFANGWGWTCYFQMDYCCEPDLGGEAAHRVDLTASSLLHSLQILDGWRARGYTHLRDPVPVIQGWEVDDYLRSVDLTGAALAGAGRLWPDLVGIGSVCRRGQDAAIIRVVRSVLGALPPHVGVHLFGVKGTALKELCNNPRIISADSQSWDRAERWEAEREGRDGLIDDRVARMERYAHDHHHHRLQPQLGLFWR